MPGFDALAAKYHFAYAPYINVFARNGDKHRDGNPIFSAEVKALNRAVRIIFWTTVLTQIVDRKYKK